MPPKRPSMARRVKRPVNPGLAAARVRDADPQTEGARAHSSSAGPTAGGFKDALKAGLETVRDTVHTAMTNDSGTAEAHGRIKDPDSDHGLAAEFGVKVQFGLGGQKGNKGGGGGGGRPRDDGPKAPQSPEPTNGLSLEDKRLETLDMNDLLGDKNSGPILEGEKIVVSQGSEDNT